MGFFFFMNYELFLWNLLCFCCVGFLLKMLNFKIKSYGEGNLLSLEVIGFKVYEGFF